MRSTVITILLLCLPILGPAQNAKITIGRGNNCFGRGACSISTENSENYNATFIQNENGTTVLRIHRTKLTKDEENRVLGQPITTINSNALNFQMDEALVLTNSIVQCTSAMRSKQINMLKVGGYPTLITTKYIDITIVAE